MKKDTCGRGLSISHKKYIQTLSKTDTFGATGTKCPSKSNVCLNIENQIKGVEKGTNSRCPFYRGVRPSIENQTKEVKKGTNCKSPFYRGVRVIEVSVKRESTVYLIKCILIPLEVLHVYLHEG